MSIKILHTSDWHLGKTLHEHSLFEDQQFVLKQLLEHIEGHDALVIAGDIYDRSLPSREAVKLFSDFISELRYRTDIPLIVIPGNHDSADRLNYLSSVVQKENIYLKSDLEDIEIPVQVKGADFYCLPYLGPASLLSTEEDDEKSEYNRRTHEAALKRALDRIKPHLSETRLNILVAHLFAQGGLTSDSERTFVGDSGQVSPSLLTDFDYVALGHLHRPQKVTEKVWYSGSLLAYSFSEAGSEEEPVDKCFLSVTVDKENVEVEQIKIDPLHRATRLKASLSELEDKNRFGSFKDDYLEIELSDETVIINPLKKLSGYFANILSIRRKDFNRGSGDEFFDNRREGTTIEDDFEAFQQFIYGDENSNLGKKKDLFAKTLEVPR